MPDHGGLNGLREQLVDRLCAAGVLRDDRVVQAFRVVPRHLFLPEVQPERTYRDEAIVTKRSPDGWSIRSSSQPTVMAVMLEQLDVGCAQGWRAAPPAIVAAERATDGGLRAGR
jgi:protein-L-isoaspartate(D-aspartate) O-methyltransferase